MMKVKPSLTKLGYVTLIQYVSLAHNN